VKVGDKLSKATKLYSAKVTINDRKRQVVNVDSDGEGGALSFVAGKDGRIKSIEVWTMC
jgi:hypothetical protein